jgi:hypothetical protein
MPHTILKNQPNGRVTIHVVGEPSGNVIVVGNNSVSNLAIGSEVMSGAIIRSLKWGCGDGFITLTRGANAVAFFNNTGKMNLADLATLGMFPAANIVVNLSANAFAILEIDKVFASVVSAY